MYLGWAENDNGLWHVDNHPDGGEGCLQVLGVWRPDSDGHHAHVEATVEGGDEVDTWGVDQGDVVPSVKAPLLQQGAGDLLRLK